MICRSLCLALLAILAGCQRKSSPEDQYKAAYDNFLQGNLVLADRQTQESARRFTVGASPGWHWKFEILRARVLLLRGQQECVPSLLRGPPADPVTDVVRKAVAVNALIKLGRYNQAEAALTDARELAEANGLQVLMPELEVRQGSLYSKRSKGELAEATLRRALDLSRQHGDSLSEADALNQLGLMRSSSKPDEAITYFERALAISQKIGAHYYGKLFEDNLAICYGQIGEFEKALAIRKAAIIYFQKSEARVALQQALGEAGNLYLDNGDSAHSVPYYTQAYELAIKIQRPSDACIWAGNLALAHTEMGRWSDAENYNSKAADLQIQLKETEPLQYLELNAALIAQGKGNVEQAESLYRDLVTVKGRGPDVLVPAEAGYGVLEASRGRWPEARVHFERALQVIGETRADLLFGEHRITFLARLIRFYQQYVELLVRQGDVERALYIADSIRALALTEGVEGENAAAVAPPLDYRAIARKWNAVLLSYWIAPHESYLWAISAKEVRLVKLAPGDTIAPLVDSYQASITKQISDPLQSGSATGRKLYDSLVGPVADMLTPGSKAIIVADGPLHNLNFDTLLTPGPASHYWIDDITLLVAPSLRVLDSGPSPAMETRTLLLIGDPEAHEPDGPKLRYARDELSAIQSQFAPEQRSVFAERQATPEAYRRMVGSGFSMVHFSAHAIANPVSPLDSAILLSSSKGDYKLFARDIMSLPLRANLVTLSACRSAGARAYAGEGLVGFSWAFLHAGAHNVIAGLWDVSDRSTAEFMGKFYAHLKQGTAPADALRATKLEFVNSSTGFRKPYYWAPFQIYTTGRLAAR